MSGAVRPVRPMAALLKIQNGQGGLARQIAARALRGGFLPRKPFVDAGESSQMVSDTRAGAICELGRLHGGP